jgi:hypothetical protein
VRFKTIEQYKQYADHVLKSSDILKKTKAVSRQSRQPYCTIEQWVTDFFALVPDKNLATPSTSQLTKQPESNDEFVVPVDEDFRRCPISGEPFKVFKDADGDELFLNAVQVFVTPKVANVFEKAKPIGHLLEAADDIRYLIIQKTLVLEQWLREDKCTTLEDVLAHPQCRGFNAELLKKAAGDEQTDEIYMML